MKKTKTGLHIQTRKNRIEVHTQKELEALELKKELEPLELKKEQQRERIIQGAIIFMLALCVAFGYLIGSAS